MRKAFFCLLSAMLCSTTAFPQSVSRSVIATAGDFTKDKHGVTVSWTVGEVFCQTMEHDRYVTEGFQQGSLDRDFGVVLTAARRNAATVQVEWHTAANNSSIEGFNVQRRYADKQEFQSISFENNYAGKRSYYFEDPENNNRVAYYRVEYLCNGKSNFSNMEMVEKINITEQITVFPNPANKNLNIQLTPGNHDQSEIIIYELSGKIIKRIQASSADPNDSFKTLTVSDLSPGSYFVKISNNNTIIGSSKFIKIN